MGNNTDRFARLSILGTALCALLGSNGVFAQTAAAPPTVAPVAYQEEHEDLRVKVLGGAIVIQRSFAEGRWHPNYNWASLRFTFDPLDGSVKTITRARSEYTKASAGVYTTGKRTLIKQTTTGFRWQDRLGNWIDYDAQGDIIAYGDRNDVKVSFQYETTTGGKRVSGIFDHLGQQVLWYEYTGDLLTAIRDATLRRVQYQYTNNQLTTVIDVLGNPWTYGYTGSLPTTFTDPENRTTTRAWTTNGELTKLTYPDGTFRVYRYDYDSTRQEHYSFEQTPGGKVTERWKNAKGEIIREDVNGRTIRAIAFDLNKRTETNARGLKTPREYDQFDNVTKITYPDTTSVSFIYDPIYSNVLQKTDERGTITKFEYDIKGNLIRLTEAMGLPEQRVTEYTYDQHGNKLTEKRLGDAVTQEAITTFEYDTKGNVTAVIDAENFRTEFTYDVMGNALTKKDARNKIWTRTYDNQGNLKTNANPLGHTDRREYDKAGWYTKTVDAANNETLLGYDARHNLITVTDPYGGITRYEYNADNQQTKQTDQEGRTQTTEYDLDGRVTRQVDGNGNAIQYIYGDAASGLDNLLVKVIYPTFTQEFKYDSRGRIAEVIDVLDTTTRLSTTITYDAAGNRSSITDKENKVTSYQFDALGHFTKITDAAHGVTEFAYDNRDNLIALKDPKGQARRFEYDSRNLKMREIRPLGQAITYAYTATGQLDALTDPKGQVKRYAYNDAGRLTGESHYLTVSAIDAAKTVSYGYNARGTLTTWGDSAALGTITYDTRQIRKTGETINYGPFSLSYNYDYFANGLKKSFTGPDGVTVNYTYDTNNQLSSIALPTGSITVNTYKWSAPEKITLPGGTARTQSYDPLLRLTGINVKDPAQNDVMNYGYSYDKADNIKTKTTEHGNYTYGYDDLYRLTQATNPSPLTNETYSYDAADNRTTDGNIAGNWSYNANNQLTAYGNVTPAYDDNGNTITKTEGANVVSYVYDAADRLTKVTTTDTVTNTTTTVATYAYDPFGRRLSKEVNNIRTYFLYSDEGLIAEADNVSGVTRLYGYQPNSTWGADPIYFKQGTNYYFFQNDHLGTSQKLVAQDGVMVWSAKAQAFGIAVVDTASTITNNLRFAGQYFDTETGMHYNWNRYYDPKTGRYLAIDPIGLAGGVNNYIYVDNNPLNFVDPTGENTIVIGGQLGSLVGPAGTVIGIGIGIGLYYLIDYLIEKCNDKPCPPCTPPRGTRCYEGPDYGKPHAGLSPHYHIFEMQQIPAPNCKCYWRYLGGKVGRGVQGAVPPGMQPCSSYSGFQGRGGGR